MTTMDFSFCEFIRKFPDVSRIPNLEKLDLDYCKNLVEVHPSVGFLDKLVSLRLEECSNLVSFPRRLKMRSLKLLSLWRCSRLKKFPEIECQMECLESINFGETGIEELPSSIGYLTGVKTLNLSGCTNLMDLPYSIHKLQHLERLFIGNMDRIVLPCLGLPYSNYQLCHLERLILSGCLKVSEFLKVVDNTRQSMPVVVSIEEDEISPVAELLPLLPSTNTSDSNDGCFSIVLPELRTLDLKNCDLSESNFFRTCDCCSTLTELYLSKSDIVTLPPCIGRFVSLTILHMNGCKALKEILGLPPNVEIVNAEECISLAIFLEEDRRFQLFNTPEALFQVGTVFPALILGNHVLAESDFLIQPDYLSSLTYLDLSTSAIVSLPAWLNKFVGLEDLFLNSCKQLREIPELPPNIEHVYAQGCTSLERFQFNNVKDLRMLEWIDFSDCHGLRENMGDDLEICLMSMVCTSF
jgi:Leucine-rich repeat (LRR) protein